MFISQAAAQEIVEEIGKEIHEHINLMDRNGFIIASTDSERIGQQHLGAVQIITEGLSELIITKEMESSHMKMGINLPIIVHGEVVGVVGITGSTEKVSGYGNIVKHMTEIMVTDTIRKNSKRYGHRVYYRFLEEWIEASSIPVYEHHFKERGIRLGIDITKKYRILAFTFREYAELSYTLEGQELIEMMETSIRHEAEHQQYLYLRTPPNQLLFIDECSDERLIQIAEHYRLLIQKKYQQILVAGYDSNFGQHRNMKQAKLECESALHYAYNESREIAGYDSLGIHFLLQQLPTSTKTEYLKHFSSRIPESKLEECLKLISAYFKYNGSLQKMSEALYLHKNTLQYKLNKLEEYTGMDIRKAIGCASYFVFLTLYQELDR